MAYIHRTGVFLTLWLGLLLLPFSVAQADRLQDFEGKPHSISEYTGQGKWLVVMIWASDCYICNKEAHQYVDFHFVHADEDASVLGISADGAAKKAEAKEFIKRHEINFPNLIGEPEEVTRMYSELTGTPWVGTPSFLIYGPNGELRAQQVGAVPTHLIEDFIKRSALTSNSAKQKS